MTVFEELAGQLEFALPAKQLTHRTNGGERRRARPTTGAGTQSRVFERTLTEVGGRRFKAPAFKGDVTFLEPGEDPVHMVTLDAVRFGINAPPVQSWLDRFRHDVGTIRSEIEQLFAYIHDARTRLDDLLQREMSIVTQDVAADHSLDSRLLQYFVLGKSITRTGGRISLPDDNSVDTSLETVLGTLRIMEEVAFDDHLSDQLPWLADKTDETSLKCKGWEQKAGDLADRIGAALGRTAAAAAQGAVSPFVKMPDEVVKGIAFVAGVTARKTAEAQMHLYVRDHPQLPTP